MLMAAKSSPTFWLFFPTHNDNNAAHLKSSKSFVLPRQPNSKFSLLSSNSSYSTLTTTLTTYASSSLTRSSNAKITDCNIKICQFCQFGDLKNAMKFLLNSKNSELDLNSYCSVLQLCAEAKSLEDGKKVHSLIVSNEVEIDAVLGTKLVFMYLNCGDLKRGRMVFESIFSEKVFLWNLLINEYARRGDFRESIRLFNHMIELGIEPNSFTFSSILKCFAAVGNFKEGRRIHGYLYKLGFSSYNAVVNSLIAFYFKNRRIDNAGKLFDDLSDRDVITWNSMISGFIMNGFEEKGIEVFLEIVSSGIDVDLATMVIVLVACANMGTLFLGKALHGYALKASFHNEIMFSNTLLDMYSKCGDLSDSIQVFKKMEVKTVVSWTSLISAYVREDRSDGAIELFHEMKSRGVSPDIFTITSILRACAQKACLDTGKNIHNYIKENNLDSNLFVCNSLMDMYAKCGCMNEAQLVFSNMPIKDIISWNTIIGGYSRNCLPNEALYFFVNMQRESKPDNITIASILPACASLAALERGREIHAYSMRKGYSSDRYVANALVDMYVKSGALILARSLFDMILIKDIVSWTVMIAGYGMHGFGKEAIECFNDMRLAGIELDEVSFISILYACSHSGLLDEGWKFFNIMTRECKIKPQLDHYACMVDLLGRTGNLSQAYSFIKAMPIKPDATVWGALLHGCRKHHNVKLAEKVAERVFELEPENAGYYVLLANIYAEAEKWEEVKQLRLKIGRRRLKKIPGCSWIEIKGKVYIFVAGGNSNPQAEKIETLLKKLRAKMKEEGYAPNMRFALIDGNEMEKEVALCGHSEKIAMAFGILNLLPGKTIRVTKNLRVCSDCHEMARFISKTNKREIILRDSNRFHHFKDGNCSCRNFW